MKILVFSDLHHTNRYMKKAIESHIGSADAVFFLGDGLSGYESLREEYRDRIAFFAVSGNCDGLYFSPNRPPLTDVINFDGFRFLLTHGHTFSVKYSLDAITSHCLQNEIDVCLFGHTHTPIIKYLTADHSGSKPLYLMNPGSISKPNEGHPSYGIMEIKKGQLLLSHGVIER